MVDRDQSTHNVDVAVSHETVGLCHMQAPISERKMSEHMVVVFLLTHQVWDLLGLGLSYRFGWFAHRIIQP